MPSQVLNNTIKTLENRYEQNELTPNEEYHLLEKQTKLLLKQVEDNQRDMKELEFCNSLSMYESQYVEALENKIGIEIKLNNATSLTNDILDIIISIYEEMVNTLDQKHKELIDTKNTNGHYNTKVRIKTMSISSFTYACEVALSNQRYKHLKPKKPLKSLPNKPTHMDILRHDFYNEAMDIYNDMNDDEQSHTSMSPRDSCDTMPLTPPNIESDNSDDNES